MAMISATFRPGIVAGAAACCLQHGLRLDPRCATGTNTCSEPPHAQGFLVLIPDSLPLVRRKFELTACDFSMARIAGPAVET